MNWIIKKFEQFINYNIDNPSVPFAMFLIVLIMLNKLFNIFNKKTNEDEKWEK